MKKFLVVLLALVMVFGLATTAMAADEQIAEFTDISELTQPAQDAIMRMAVLGVLEGNEGLGGAYRPADNLTRAEFAKIVVLVSGKGDAASAEANKGYNSPKFPDITAGNWYTGWVNIAAENGYFKGDTNGEFRANAQITAQEVSTVLLRVVGYDDHVGGGGNGNYGEWPASYNNKARAVGLLDNVVGYVGNQPLNRGNMATMLDNMVELNLVAYISNEFAASTAIAEGYGDTDWFVEKDYRTNENDPQQDRRSSNILEEAFDAYARTVRFSVETGRAFDEVEAWSYDDFTDGEYTLNIQAERISTNPERWTAASADIDDAQMASKYFITRGFNFPELANMYAKVTFYDKSRDEACFLQVLSSFEEAMKVYAESSSRLNIDGKSTQQSTHKFYSFTGAESIGVDSFIDLTARSFTSTKNVRELYNSGKLAAADTNIADKDNTFPAKVYFDAEGRVYAVRNTKIFDYVDFDQAKIKVVDGKDTIDYASPFYFGIFNDLDGNIPEYKVGDTNDAPAQVDYTDDDIVYYRDGKFISEEDITENDVVYYLNNATGAHFFLVKAPLDGEFTKKTSTAFVVSGNNYGATPTAAYFSDDAGDRFSDLTLATVLDDTVYGDATFVKAYNHGNVAYISSEAGSTKLYGVITEVNASYKYVAGQANPAATVSGVTVVNGEGKEISYNFITDLKDEYNGTTKGLAPAHKYLGNDAKDRTYHDKVNDFVLEEGMLIRFTLNSSGDIRRIDDYVPMNIGTEGTVTVNKDRQRLSVPSTDASNNPVFAPPYSSRGALYLTDDVLIFNVTPDANNNNAFKSAKVLSLSSLLSSDFKAHQLFSFATVGNMKGADTTVLYVVQTSTTDELGFLNTKQYDGEGFKFGIDGTLTLANDSGFKATPAFVIYNVIDGEVTVADADVLATKGSLNITNGTLLADIAAITDNDNPVLVGVATDFSSSNNKVKLLVTGDLFDKNGNSERVEMNVDASTGTYIWDFYARNTVDGAVVSARDLKGHHILAVLDDNNDALYVIGIDEAMAAQAGFVAGADALAAQELAGKLETTHGLASTAISVSGATVTIELNAALTLGAPLEIPSGVTVVVTGTSATINADATNKLTVKGTLKSAEVVAAADGGLVVGTDSMKLDGYLFNAAGDWTARRASNLTSAISKSNAIGLKVTLNGDDVTASAITIPADVVLDLNGKTLTANHAIGATADAAIVNGKVKIGTGSIAYTAPATVATLDIAGATYTFAADGTYPMLYTINTPAAITSAVKDVTATATVDKAWATDDEFVTVTVTLAGGPVNGGDLTVNVTATNITALDPATAVTITSGTNITVGSNDTYTFKFKVTDDVANLAIALN